MEIFLTGIGISILHVLSGPDHLAAVSPLAAENGKKSWLIGFFWGVGHTLGVLLLGMIFLMFRELLPIEKISAYSEKVVGITIICIGFWAIFRQIKQKNSSHAHVHRKKTIGAITVVGIIHGFAGFSHLIGILPTLSLPSRLKALLYLSGFALGTIAAMLSFALAVGLISQKLSFKPMRLSRFCLILGCIAVLVGFFWVLNSSF